MQSVSEPVSRRRSSVAELPRAKSIRPKQIIALDPVLLQKIPGPSVLKLQDLQTLVDEKKYQLAEEKKNLRYIVENNLGPIVMKQKIEDIDKLQRELKKLKLQVQKKLPLSKSDAQ